MTTQKPSLKVWILALRPKTLAASISPIMIATAMAYANDKGNAVIALICLLTALLLQIGTNIANDYFDFQKGADTEERLGPVRVTQAGLLKPSSVKTAFIICFSLAALGWMLLTLHAGIVMALLGVSSILSGIFYTAGSKALGYVGLGDLFVFLFFGLAAVAGTYYAQALEFSNLSLIAGIAPGLISVAILSVNNLRDIEGDRGANKKTLAVRFGISFARYEYLFSLLIAAFIPVVLFLNSTKNFLTLMASIVMFLAVPLIKTVMEQQGEILNSVLAKTGQLLLIYSFVFSLTWLLG